MALKLHTTYPGRFDSPSENYPQGKWRNRSNSTAHDGGYLEEKHMNDIYGFFGALLRNAEMSPNGEVDTAKKSQFYDALVAVAKKVVGEEGYRKLDDNVFNGYLQVRSEHEGQGTGVFLQDTDGTVRGQVVATDQGLQLTQYPKDGGLQTFTFPNVGGEITVDKTLPYITPEMFGAVGDGIHDDTNAISEADVVAYSEGKVLKFKSNTYLVSNGITKRSHWVGEKPSQIWVFPLHDDKVNLKEGGRLNGTCIKFVGSGTNTVDLEVEEDFFRNVSYAVYSPSRIDGCSTGTGMENITILCAFDFEKDGKITKPNNDNSASYDVGLLLHNNEKGYFRNCYISGYWEESGLLHVGKDPDNTHFYNCSFMGNRGVSILGEYGTNSGSNFIGCNISSNDHHSRSVDTGNEKWGDCAVYINIPSSGVWSRNSINFIGGSISTKTDIPIKFDACGAINFTNVMFEISHQEGSEISTTNKRLTGTSRTRDLSFISCRRSQNLFYGEGKLIDTSPNSIINIIGGDDFSRGYEYWQGSGGVRISGTTGQQNIILTQSNEMSSNSGLALVNAIGNNLKILKKGKEILWMDEDSIKTIPYSSNISAEDTIKLNGNGMYKISGTGDINNISPEDIGTEVIIERRSSTDTWILKNRTGNVRLKSDVNASEFNFGILKLIYNGQFWVETGRSSQ